MDNDAKIRRWSNDYYTMPDCVDNINTHCCQYCFVWYDPNESNADEPERFHNKDCEDEAIYEERSAL